LATLKSLANQIFWQDGQTSSLQHQWVLGTQSRGAL